MTSIIFRDMSVLVDGLDWHRLDVFDDVNNSDVDDQLTYQDTSLIIMKPLLFHLRAFFFWRAIAKLSGRQRTDIGHMSLSPLGVQQHIELSMHHNSRCDDAILLIVN